ncbi:ribonuclease Trv [Sodiomyces alkalinus F11]|uniref:ribonuclease T2 n=1 Tax=Sodiomyces alkalinus (strain CBS 110278 / VKM F-3762 / F11) TaxID=1314773 RepID=A0A3N2PZF5_SODAK|nr:ribonuclease Trv [Sodiomyces alkalinus F11]ROT39894.1 ribonuclease Trv [Sodiomyces alkalinus F11]
MAPRISLRGLFNNAAGFLSRLSWQTPLSPLPNQRDVVHVPYLGGVPSCPIDGPISCRNNTPVTGDTCCFVHPSGRLLLAQFWDQEAHVPGAEEDWTLHGLWPDLCDGSYEAYCGMTPHFSNISDILTQYGQDELLALMHRYWVAASGSNEHLWTHEYNKHASCINTLTSSCYGGDYRPGMEAVEYFTRAFHLFRNLDTYMALAWAGIVPTHESTYELAVVQKALEKYSGGSVVLKCSGHERSVMHEAWYAFFVQGNLQSGRFIPARGYGEHGDVGNCADQVWYLPKKCRWPGGCDRGAEL